MLHEDEVHAAQEVDPSREQMSFWGRLRRAFAHDERWRSLNWTIVAYPNVAANYLLRGELLFHQGDTIGAISDFRKALQLAAEQAETDDWGVVAQALQDRALADLRDALRRATRYNPGTG